MRYIFIGDVHGQLDKLIDAIKRENGTVYDTYVFLGDLFDRGPDSKNLLKFVLALSHTIFIAGNHDLRLKELYYGMADANKYDMYNGVGDTLESFTGMKVTNEYLIRVALLKLINDDEFIYLRRLLEKYFDKLVFAAEWKREKIIATHAQLPNDYETATAEEWYNVSWGETPNFMMKVREEGNNRRFNHIVLGHWHTWRLRRHFGFADWGKVIIKKTGIASDYDIQDLNHSPFVFENFICLDGCSNMKEGIVGSYVVELDGEPILWKGRV